MTELDLFSNKFHDWAIQFGNKNQHDEPIPRWFWRLESEKEAILEYYKNHPEEGYCWLRKLSYRMLDENVAAVSHSCDYRMLKRAGKLGGWAKRHQERERAKKETKNSRETGIIRAGGEVSGL